MAGALTLVRPHYGRLKPASAPMPLAGPTVDDRWMENSLTRRLMPGQVEAILRNGLSGDLTDQLALFNLMQDTWPHLARNVRTLRDAVKAAPYEVHAWSDDDGTELTQSAQDKAALVKRAMWGTQPQLGKLELVIEDVIGGQAVGTVTGHAVHEILWETRVDAAGTAILPRAFRRVAARHFGYPAMSYGQADHLRFSPTGRGASDWTDFPAGQFILGIYPGHDGHPSVAAPLRSLAKYWVAACFGPEWLLSYAQLFGQPFRWATYRPGDKAAKDAVCSMLANMGGQAWAAFPEGTKLELKEAAKAAGELPQKLIIDMANAAASILILGQTLTSDTGDSGGGSFALGKVHSDVRREILSACATEVAKTLTHNLARAVVELNYGECTECPEIRAEIPEPTDAKAEAERDEVLVRMGMKLPLDWLYERHNVPEPMDDEPTLSGGPAAPPPVPGAPVPPSPDPAKDQGKTKQPVPGDPEEDPAKQEDPSVKAARAALPDSFLNFLTDTYDQVLQVSYKKGWEAAQIDFGNPEADPAPADPVPAKPAKKKP